MRTKICLVLAVLLIAAICLCPFPVRINTCMEGMHINEQQELVENVTVNVSGWRYNFLFLQDKIKLSFDSEALGTLDNMRTSEHEIDPSTRCAGLFFYSGSLNSFSSGTVTYDKDFSSCLMELDGEIFGADGSACYVLSSDPDADLWNVFKEHLQRK